jgi:L-2-hydroxyglutarate oxidase
MKGYSLKYDFIVIGAGIVGLSTAWQLLKRQPHALVLLLDKEATLAVHQSGRNSGVIHAGVYYEPGSLKARLCKEGATATYDFCRSHGVACERTGKLLVATNETETVNMQALYERCRKNGLDPQRLSASELKEIEPAVTGSGALLIRASGIADYPGICRAMLDDFLARGGAVRFDTEVKEISESGEEIQVQAALSRFRSRRLVVCGGLMADRLARAQGLDIDFRTVPYRGEYYRLAAGLKGLVRRLIYPIPNPELPFLGIHLTRMTDGSITVGPNAVQGWKREGYGRFNFNLRDTAGLVAFPGFWKTTAKNLRHGIRETWSSVSKTAYLASVRKYCPQITLDDLEPHPVGIRAQAVLRDGTLVHDFLLKQTARSLHVCNAPSPAATSAIPIGRYICDKLLGQASQI